MSVCVRVLDFQWRANSEENLISSIILVQATKLSLAPNARAHTHFLHLGSSIQLYCFSYSIPIHGLHNNTIHKLYQDYFIMYYSINAMRAM